MWPLHCLGSSDHCIISDHVTTILSQIKWSLYCLRSCDHYIVSDHVTTALSRIKWSLYYLRSCDHYIVSDHVAIVLFQIMFQPTREGTYSQTALYLDDYDQRWYKKTDLRAFIFDVISNPPLPTNPKIRIVRYHWSPPRPKGKVLCHFHFLTSPFYTQSEYTFSEQKHGKFTWRHRDVTMHMASVITTS